MPAAGFSSEEDSEKRADSDLILSRYKTQKHIEKTKDVTSQEGNLLLDFNLILELFLH
jgi:hypothetical protein